MTVLAAALLATSLLAACSDDDGGDDGEEAAETSEATEESSSPSDPDTPEPSGTAGPESTDDPDGGGTTAGALPAACDVLTADDIAAAYGVTVGPGSIGGGGHSEQDVEWQSDNCSWEADDLVEVDFALSGPDDFPAGFTCPEPLAIASQVEPVEVPGATRAFWDVDDSPPLEAVLRVCTDAFVFDIELEYEDGAEHEGDPRQQSIGLAKTALAALGG
ncbi:hypothetical protein [Nocardioides sp. TF02-7]|uniref:hypothetical protein n=1 Tax=Nocardioides sp. TF02-7 TaxID=2917724 RepID=UPI001F0606CF|nr:hypothetical protein [Nocardioides sp. TF02-7]UMG94213.1 hypothetical protein MF408_09420 [Nocardioides sp. TF02-7]